MTITLYTVGQIPSRPVDMFSFADKCVPTDLVYTYIQQSCFSSGYKTFSHETSIQCYDGIFSEIIARLGTKR